MNDNILVLDKLYTQYINKLEKVCDIKDIDEVFLHYKNALIPVNYIPLNLINLIDFEGYFGKDVKDKIKNYNPKDLALSLSCHFTAATTDTSSTDIYYHSCIRYIIANKEKLENSNSEEDNDRYPILKPDDIIEFGAEIIFPDKLLEEGFVRLARAYNTAFKTQITKFLKNENIKVPKATFDNFIRTLKLSYLSLGYLEEGDTVDKSKEGQDKRFDEISLNITNKLMSLSMLNAFPILASYYSLSTEEIVDMYNISSLPYNSKLISVDFSYMTTYKILVDKSEYDLVPVVTFDYGEGHDIIELDRWDKDDILNVSDNFDEISAFKGYIISKYKEMQNRITAEEYDYLYNALFDKVKQLFIIKDNSPYRVGDVINMTSLFSMLVMKKDDLDIERDVSSLSETLFNIFRIQSKLSGDELPEEMESYGKFREGVLKVRNDISKFLESEEFKSATNKVLAEAIGVTEEDLDESKYIN